MSTLIQMAERQNGNFTQSVVICKWLITPHDDKWNYGCQLLKLNL